MYKAKQFNLSGLKGISDQTLEMHFKLYEGYVKETNNLQEKISQILKDGKVDQEEMPAYSEFKRRLGFEYNGMVLHEYYFGNLEKGGAGQPECQVIFCEGRRFQLRHYDIWKADFVGIGKMRGVGLGHMLSRSVQRTVVEPLDLAPRDRQRRRLQSSARNGRVGACFSAGL